LALLKPAMVHYNQTALILEQHQTVLDAVYRVHPERLVRQAPKPAVVSAEVWINKSSTQMKKLSKFYDTGLKLIDTRRSLRREVHRKATKD
jgi:hypothetical protein